MRKVIDVFLYNGEENTIDLRIKILNTVVDEFWIIESNITFSGKKKPLLFQSQSTSRNWPLSKIRYFTYLPEPNEISANPWRNEIAQRNYLSELICFSKENDLILYSDVDEIPSPEAITEACNATTSEYFGFEMSTHYFRFNYFQVSPKVLARSICTVGFFKSALETHSPEELRHGIRDGSITADVFRSGGWHFSYMMDEEMIKKKIDSFSHQEFNTPEVISNIQIERILDNKEDLFSRPGYQWDLYPIKNLPDEIRKHQFKYAKCLILPKYRRIANTVLSIFWDYR